MFSFIKKRIRRRQAHRQASHGRAAPVYGARTPIDVSLEKNLKGLKALFGVSQDFVERSFLIRGERKAAVCYIDGLVKGETINDAVLKPLVLDSRLIEMDPFALGSIGEIARAFTLATEIDTEKELSKAAEACLDGDAVLFVEKMEEALILNAKGWEKRAITEPLTDTVIRGPREGFTESLRTNTAMVRRRLKTPDLRMEHMVLGARSRTRICVAYLERLANPALVGEVRRRLAAIHTDAIINSGYIEEFIEDTPLSVFPTIYHTEKPDIVAAKLLEGRVAVLIDGTPFALTMPLLFIESFQTSEDYAVRSPFALVLRLIRLLSFFISLMAPALYVALSTYHQELIPMPLLFTMAAASDGLPFPAAVETAVMLAAFEFIKEAGIRLPKPVGQAISIVGALVMGQAATQAGVVGAPVVIVIALTAVTGYTAPFVSDVLAILRWYLLLLAATLGGLGITLGMLTLLLYLACIKSFGADYLAPLAPFHAPDALRDTLYRAPLWDMPTRPAALKPLDMVRQKAAKPRFSDDKLPERELKRK